MGDNLGQIPEGRLRPLAALPEGARKEAYEEAVAESGGKPTAAKVREVMDRKLAAPPATELVGDPDRIQPFRDAAEMRTAFAAHLAVQAEYTAVMERPGGSRQAAESRAVASKLSESYYGFTERLPDEGLPDGACYSITFGGDTYVTIWDFGRPWWCKAKSFDLDARNRPAGAARS